MTDMSGMFESAGAAKDYMLAGHATITLRSKKTGTRFTYRVSAPKNTEACRPNDIRFVALLGGPDNENDYRYFGTIRPTMNGTPFRHGGAKAKVAEDAPSVSAFHWAWRYISLDILPDSLEVWHEGSCGRCGRKLTVPESVARGIGPECAKHMSF